MNIKELKEAAGKATPGRWSADLSQSETWTAGVHSAKSGDAIIWPSSKKREPETGIVRDEDATYIALANPSTILSLIARVEQMEEALRPFAAKYDECRPAAEDVREGYAKDLDETPDAELALITVPLGELRRVRAALETPANPIEEVVDADR